MSFLSDSFSVYADLVFVLPYDKGSRCFLAVHRSDDKTWGLLGGKSIRGETAIDAIRREAFEEAKVWLTAPKPSYEFNPIENLSCIVFVAAISSGVPLKLNRESLDARWVRLNDWPQPAHPQMKRVIDENADGFIADALTL